MGLFGLYLLYALVISPRLVLRVPEDSPERLSVSPAASPRLATEMAEKYLASQAAWAVNPGYHFRTANTFIYAEEWDPADDSDESIRFKRFAMIWQKDGQPPDEAPITIVSQSALVKFENTFRITDLNPGRAVGGALEGDVLIRGPNGLAVKGRNFAFDDDAKRIWSDEPVSFTYGPHRGRAQGAQIELIAAKEPQGNDSLAFSGIRSIRLRGEVFVDLVDEDKKQKKPPVLVRIRSAGSFEYVFATHIATFEDDVRVLRPTDASHVDSLRCDLLTLVFEPEETPPEPFERGSATSDANERFQGLGGGSKLTFRRLRAEGERVELISQANKLTAWMTELIYDAESKMAALSDPDRVKVTHESSQLTSPEITLSHDDDGKIVSAWCWGAGWMKHHDPQTGRIRFEAQWAKLLHKYPDPREGLDVIELQEQAVVHQPEEKTLIAAELIRLWIDPQEKSRDAGDANAPRRDSERDSERIHPKRLLALRNVRVNSPELQVTRTNQLDVLWFAGGTQLQPSPALPVQHTPPDGLQPAVRRVSYRGRNGPAAGREDPRGRDEPLQVAAEKIRVHMVPGSGQSEPEVSDIWTEGNVQLHQRHDPGTDPLRLTGNRLHLQNRGEGDQVLHLYGRPAHIRDRGMHIEGGEVHFDRNRNLAWVTGSGLLEILVKQDLEGRLLETPTLLDVWWKEQMTFDGERASFFGDVRAVLGDSRMSCHEMQVLLTERLSFTDDRKRPDVKIRSILCKDGVEFDSYEYEANKLVQIRRAHFGEFAVDQLSGNFEGRGPGWMTRWGRGRGDRAALSPVATVQANQPLRSESADWEYTRIDFAGKADGNIKNRFTEFHDRVEIVYGPVERPLDTVDPENLPKKGGWMRCDVLEVVQHEETKTDPSHIELKAVGNARLEGHTFHAQAEFIRYDESKKFYMLHSLGNPKATIWRQTELGGKLEKATAQRIEFFPARNEFKLDRTTGLHGGQ